MPRRRRFALGGDPPRLLMHCRRTLSAQIAPAERRTGRQRPLGVPAQRSVGGATPVDSGGDQARSARQDLGGTIRRPRAGGAATPRKGGRGGWRRFWHDTRPRRDPRSREPAPSEREKKGPRKEERGHPLKRPPRIRRGWRADEGASARTSRGRFAEKPRGRPSRNARGQGGSAPGVNAWPGIRRPTTAPARQEGPGLGTCPPTRPPQKETFAKFGG